MAAKQIGVTDKQAYRAYDRLLWAERERCDDLAEAIEQFTWSLIDADLDLSPVDMGEIVRATYQAFRLAYATVVFGVARPVGDESAIMRNPRVPHTEDI